VKNLQCKVCAFSGVWYLYFWWNPIMSKTHSSQCLLLQMLLVQPSSDAYWFDAFSMEGCRSPQIYNQLILSQILPFQKFHENSSVTFCVLISPTNKPKEKHNVLDTDKKIDTIHITTDIESGATYHKTQVSQHSSPNDGIARHWCNPTLVSTVARHQNVTRFTPAGTPATHKHKQNRFNETQNQLQLWTRHFFLLIFSIFV